jgi:hypothetical protein
VPPTTRLTIKPSRKPNIVTVVMGIASAREARSINTILLFQYRAELSKVTGHGFLGATATDSMQLYEFPT